MDSDPLHEIASLVLSLPEPWRGSVIGVATFCVTAALLVNGGRAIATKLGWKPDPNPPTWKRALYRLLDCIALNAKPFMAQVELIQKERAIAAQQFAIAQKDEVIERKTAQLYKAHGLPADLRSMRGTNDDEVG